MSTDTRMALAIDELLHHPHFNQIAQWAAQAMPVGELDQLQAASRDTNRVSAFIADHIGAQPHMRAPDGIPDWVRLGLLQAWSAHCLNTADTCLHSPTVERPEPVTAAAWRPGLVVCMRCSMLLAIRYGSEASRTCDGCGHVCAGTEHDDPIYPNSVVFGTLIYQFGACRACRSEFGIPNS